jgi:hypothetical protein
MSCFVVEVDDETIADYSQQVEDAIGNLIQVVGYWCLI